MNITTEALENRQVRLIIEVDKDRSEKAMRSAARQIAKQVRIPGFRKGKAPYDVIVRRFGEDTVRQEAAEPLTKEVYQEALEQTAIEPYAPGVLEDISVDPFTFRLVVPLPPAVDLGDYRAYRLKPQRVRVYKKQVEQALEEIRANNAILEPVERPVEMSDVVTLNLLAHGVDGTEVLKAEDTQVLVDDGNENLILGFAEAVLGMQADEERSFTLRLPDDFPQESLRGQEAEFAVKMTAVHNRTLPDLDDDLARAAGNFDSLQELEKHVKGQLRQAAQARADEEYAGKVLEAIIEQSQIEYPPMILDGELDDAVEQVERSVKREARLTLEDYLRLQSKSMNELRDELKPGAEQRLRRALVMTKVVELEKLVVDQEEISAQIEGMSAPWGDRADEMRASLNSSEGQRTITSRLLGNKAAQRLVAIARGEAPEPTDESAPIQESGEADAPEESEGPAPTSKEIQ